MTLTELKKRRAMLILLLRHSPGHKEQAKIKLEISELEEQMILQVENEKQIKML